METNDADAWVVARTVLRGLTGSASVIALGEVTPTALDRLRAESGYEIVADEALDTDVGIGVLFDPARVRVAFTANIDAALRNREMTRALEFVVLSTPDLPPISVIVVHWPSRMVVEHAQIRMTLGSGIQTHINNRLDRGNGNVFIIVCGDFNDDPFELSLTANLFGTRDRALAQKHSRALYNPFWRLLGERKTLEAVPPHTGAGTCFWRSGTLTQWHTFDQFLFTSNFLGDNEWQLVEGLTEVWDQPPLTIETGAIHPSFDHYPVLVTVRPYTQEDSNE